MSIITYKIIFLQLPKQTFLLTKQTSFLGNVCLINTFYKTLNKNPRFLKKRGFSFLKNCCLFVESDKVHEAFRLGIIRVKSHGLKFSRKLLICRKVKYSLYQISVSCSCRNYIFSYYTLIRGKSGACNRCNSSGFCFFISLLSLTPITSLLYSSALAVKLCWT